MAKAPDLPQCNGPRPPSLRLFDSAREGSGTLERGRRDWHLPRRAAACGLAGALLGPAAVGVSALKARALVAVFSITLPFLPPTAALPFYAVCWDVMVTERCDGDCIAVRCDGD